MQERCKHMPFLSINKYIAYVVATLKSRAQNKRKIMNSSFSLSLAALCCVVVVLGGFPFSSNAQLDPNFYKDTCPNVTSIVKQVLANVSQTDPRMLASFIRLHFHDCFVQVCIIYNNCDVILLKPH
jgi:hypothetical protein